MKKTAIFTILVVAVMLTNLCLAQDEARHEPSMLEGASRQSDFDRILTIYKTNINVYIDSTLRAWGTVIPGSGIMKLKRMIKHFHQEKSFFDQTLKEYSALSLNKTTVELDSVMLKAVSMYDWCGNSLLDLLKYHDGEFTAGRYFSYRFGHHVEVTSAFHQFGEWMIGALFAAVIGLIVWHGKEKEKYAFWTTFIVVFIIFFIASFFVMF